MCRTRGVSPAAATTSSAASKATSCSALVALLGASATAKCDQTPVTCIVPLPSSWAARSTSAGQSPAVAPLRPNPVSTFSWTRARTPVAWDAAVRASSCHRELAVTSISSRTQATRSSSPGDHSQARIGTVIPCWRSSAASDSRAVPSQSAPPAMAALAEGSSPWPYASALTTASSAAEGACERSTSTLAEIASRSTSHTARATTAPSCRTPWPRACQVMAEAAAACAARRAAQHVHSRHRTALRASQPARETVQANGARRDTRSSDRIHASGASGRGEHPGDESGEHVTGASRGQRGITEGVHVGHAPGPRRQSRDPSGR